MAEALEDGASWPGAVAVSGGADSTALMVLLAEWARESGRQPPVVLTVDHGLVRDSARTAEKVFAQAGALSLEAHVLHWRGRKPSSDIEGAARTARYRLMGNWCNDGRLGALYVAHSREDQAETFLLRLARGSGVDGLAAMANVSPFPLAGFGNLGVVRPLLTVPRAGLRAYLAGRKIDWHEDPMNLDPRFARARLRAMWPALEQAGLSSDRIVTAARHLARARNALDHNVVALLDTTSRIDREVVLLDGPALAAAPREIGLRALSRLLMQVSAREYRPRFERLESLFDAVCTDSLEGGRTLHGCVVRPAPRKHQCFGATTILITLEPHRSSRC
ncbi:MAG TPA: tRNA lysidine(34) synthetase TilS [Rhizomicrobium sp.]|jgi:tRNA(Ile)-lysidine synthase|nr:tRNA lysidine(34) synthetase TilS [Rhizomicrobium sp.]